MNEGVRAELRSDALLASHAAATALAAAEVATIEGRLNLAKVLRAAALASRANALRLERMAARGQSSRALFAEIHVSRAALAERLRTQADHNSLTVEERTSLLAIANSGQSLHDIFARTDEALRAERDVPESVVAQFLFGCEECGYIAEASRPDICPACGSIAGEWALFPPFYSYTSEHILRRTPEEITSMLGGDSARLREALVGHSDAALRFSPGGGEWCAKVIAGHMIDIAELFTRRLRALLEPGADAPEATLLPWKIIDGQNYPDVSADALTARFDGAIGEGLGLIARLERGDWRKKADMLSGRVPVIDMGSWLANHNVAHLEQIRDRLQSVPSD